FALSPVRIALPQLDDLLLPHPSGLPRTEMRTTAAFGEAHQTLFLIPPQPHISSGPGYLELPTEGLETLLPPTRRHHKTHPLFLNIHTSPCHPGSRSRPPPPPPPGGRGGMGGHNPPPPPRPGARRA